MCRYVFISFGYILRSRIARSDDNPIFNILNNYKEFSKEAQTSVNHNKVG